MRRMQPLIVMVFMFAVLLLPRSALASTTPAKRAHVTAAVCTGTLPTYNAHDYCTSDAVIFTGLTETANLVVHFATRTTHKVWLSVSKQYADSPNYDTIYDNTFRVASSFAGITAPLNQLMPSDATGKLTPGMYRIDGDVDGQPMPTISVSVYVGMPASGGGVCKHPHCNPNGA